VLGSKEFGDEELWGIGIFYEIITLSPAARQIPPTNPDFCRKGHLLNIHDGIICI
jgi:hypothetical protein